MELYLRALLTLAIGLLIGLQRERVKGGPAGIRTFALIAAAGYLVGRLGEAYGGGVVAGGLVFLAAILVVGNLIDARKDADHGGGATTEVAALVVFAIGAYLSDPARDESLAVLLAGVVALVLHYKRPLHEFVRALEPAEVRSIMQFVLITLVVLPVLPNRTFGPYGVLNPFEAWLMVMLIVGIGFVAYLAYRLVGSRAGTLLGGLLGGIVSSTATTVSASRMARASPSGTNAAALIVLLASLVSVVRIVVEMAVVNARDLPVTLPPLLAFFAVFLIPVLWLYRRRSAEIPAIEPPPNPAGIKPALVFGGLYVLVVLAVAAAKERAGTAGLFGIAVLSGLTDVDAITLSTAALVERDGIDAATGWRAILLAAMANLVFKFGIVAFSGGRALLQRIAPGYAVAFLAGLAIFFFWP